MNTFPPIEKTDPSPPTPNAGKESAEPPQNAVSSVVKDSMKTYQIILSLMREWLAPLLWKDLIEGNETPNKNR